MTFTTIGYGDLTPHNEYEAVVTIVIMMFSAACFAQILAVFSTLVADSFKAVQVRNNRARSLHTYARWRALTKDLERTLLLYVQNLMTDYGGGQWQLPEYASPPQLHEYELQIMTALTVKDQKVLRMHNYGRLIRETDFLYWMSPFTQAVKEAVDAVVFKVYSPGSTLFEIGDEVDTVYFLTGGSVTLDEGEVAREIASTAADSASECSGSGSGSGGYSRS